MKALIRKLLGVLFSYFSCALGLVLACSKSWRVWEFESTVVPIMFFGLWEVVYVHDFNVSGVVVETIYGQLMNDSWIISDAMLYGQDLILLANFMKLVVLNFGTLALWVSWIKAPYPDFLRMCYKISAHFVILSSVCTLMAVIWNYTEDFYGKNTFDFPSNFPVKIEEIKRKQHSYVFPLGIVTASLSILGALSFSYEQYVMQVLPQVKPNNAKQKV